MKISTKGRYALRLLLDLALYGEKGPVKLKEIAARQGISDKYLEQIIAVLNKAGYVKSVRGPQGGYRLARLPEEYTVGMILRLTEGSLTPVNCLDQAEEGGGGCCSRWEDCVTFPLWQELDAAIRSVVDHVTLQELLNRKSRETEPRKQQQPYTEGVLPSGHGC